MGTTALRKVQFGRESTWGTGVAAAAIMSGVSEFSFNPGITTALKRYLSGSFTPAQSSALVRQEPTAKISGDVTPEDVIYLLDSCVKGSVSPTGANPYVYAFTFPTTAVGAIRPRTWEFYDGSQGWELNGGLVNKITFKGADGSDNVTFDAELIGKQAVATTITGALSARSFTLLPTLQSALYIDGAGGTIGSTAVTATLIDWEYTVDMGLHTKFFMDGGTTATSWGYGIPSVMLKCSMEYNSSAHTELTAHLAATPKLIRIRCTGSGDNKVDFDIAGVATSMGDLFGDRDGNTIVEGLTYEARLDTGTFANYAAITVTNTVSSFVSNA
jgi:hypothetical protein